MMQLLLERGADPKVATANGVNALHAAAGLRWSDNSMSWAVAQGLATEEMSLAAVNMLLERGLDVNAVDDQGATALHGAASRGANEIIRLLVGKGARLDLKTKPRVRQQTVDNEPPLNIPATNAARRSHRVGPGAAGDGGAVAGTDGAEDPNAPIRGPSRRR